MVMGRNGVLLFFVALATSILAAPAPGGLVTWQFGGEIQQVRDTNNVLGGALSTGSPFSGSLTFDPLTPDTDGDAGVSAFQNPLLDLSGSFGNIAFSGPVSGISSIGITNGPPGSDDIFSLSSSVFLDDQWLNFLLTLTDSSGTAFSSDSLSAVPPDLGLFDSTTIRLLRQTNDLTIDSELTVLTPDPGTLWLLSVGAAVVLRRRGRR